MKDDLFELSIKAPPAGHEPAGESPNLLSKRDFMKTAALTTGAMAIGGTQTAFAADTVFDIIVIGAGTAGIPLAAAAAERGANVLLIEKSGQVGGTLFLSGGHVAAAGTRMQARMGIEDSADLHYSDIMRLSNGLADPALSRMFVDNAAPTMDWLEDYGFMVRDGEPVTGADHNDFSARRYYQGPEFGISLLKALRKPFDAAYATGRIKLLLWTGAVELIQDRTRAVTGVVVEGPDGTRADYRGRNVVITSGGYTANPKMFKALTGKPLYSRWSYQFSQGKGIELGLAAGGVLRGAEYQMMAPTLLRDRNYPSPVEPFNPVTDPRRREIWEIQVNAQGHRFMREEHPNIDVREVAFTRQPGVRSWIVFDQEILERAPTMFPTRTKAEIAASLNFHPLIAKAATLEELALKTQLPPTALKATIADYNSGVKSGRDRFGREFLPAPIARGPFYAVELSSSSVVGFGGLKVDPQLRVLDTGGAPIPNLHAAGEVLGLAATCGNVFVSGGAVTPALIFGRLLGQRLPVGRS